VLRTASGDARRAVVAALVAERDPRRPDAGADSPGERSVRDHAMVIDTISALALIRTDIAVPPLVRSCGEAGSRARMRAVKASISALMKMGSDTAWAARQAGKRGDRQLGKIVKRMQA
jgi:hypothetical protein